MSPALKGSVDPVVLGMSPEEGMSISTLDGIFKVKCTHPSEEIQQPLPQAPEGTGTKASFAGR